MPSSGDVIDYLLSNPGHQGRDQDWIDNVISQIEEYDEWALTLVPVAVLLLMPANERARRYAKRRSAAPPIVVVPDTTSRRGSPVVIDGNARANAARIRGEEYICAFVPLELAKRFGVRDC